jgi:hypothetical protein
LERGLRDTKLLFRKRDKDNLFAAQKDVMVNMLTTLLLTRHGDMDPFE